MLTPAMPWAQIVNSGFSMAKHCHVFIGAEALKRYLDGGLGPGIFWA